MGTFKTLPEIFLQVTSTGGRADAFNYPEGDGWITYSHADMRERVKHLALGLASRGVEPGESIGLIAPSSPLWIAVDLAIQIAGGVTVPIFKRISVDSFVHEVRDSAMRTLFVGNPDEMPMAFQHSPPGVELVSFWYSGSHGAFEKLLAEGRRADAEDPARFERMCAKVAPEDLATVIYTSGSTGMPKGVELTQRNLVSQVYDSAVRFPIDGAKDVCLSTLPLEHIFERMVMYFYLSAGVPVYFVDDPKKVGAYMARVRPTIMTVVPRILEKAVQAMKEATAGMKGAAGILARAAVARAQAKDVDAPRGPLDALYARVVYPRLTHAFGGRFRHVICGSASLHPDIARFLVNIGLPIYEGYGLTEAAPVIAANYEGRRRIGTVGLAFPSVEVKIGEDGEVLARGPNVMRGYHNDPVATAAVIQDDGWLRTGDLGSLDARGFLTISGRKKELFKKSTGEYVPPIPIEHALAGIPFVDTAVVVADNRPYVVALLFVDPARLREFQGRSGLSGLGETEFLGSDYLRRTTRELIEPINERLHHCERIERFAFVGRPASVEEGEITPTLKPRRFNIERAYSGLIEDMYRSIGGWK